MKFFNTKTVTLVALLFSLSFTACKKDPDPVASNAKIEGEWKLKLIERNLKENGTSKFTDDEVGEDTFNFKEGGELTISGEVDKYSWALTENKFLSMNVGELGYEDSDFKGEVTTLSATTLVALSKETLTEEQAKEVTEALGVPYKDGATYTIEIKVSFERKK